MLTRPDCSVGDDINFFGGLGLSERLSTGLMRRL